jgi:ethanolamine utilization protein EutN
MLLCRVEGSAISTIRHPSLKGWRLLICQPLNENGEKESLPILCLDNLGAGKHQIIIVTSDGKSVREKMGFDKTPARYMSIALVDDVQPAEESSTGLEEVA